MRCTEDKVFFDDLEYYKYQEYGIDDTVGGSRSKIFLRLSGKFFQELFEELRNNPNCSYDTYLNNVIRDGYNPKCVSVLAYRVNGSRDAYSSTRYNLDDYVGSIACRVLNYFECPTTYEIRLDFGGIDNTKRICSVDFAKCGEEMYTLRNLGRMIDVPSTNIFVLLDKLNTCIYNNKWYIDFCNSDQERELCLDTLKENIVYSWLIRRVFMADWDYLPHNMGLIHDIKNNTFRMAPNFDLEKCFSENETGILAHFLDCLPKLVLDYPNVLTKFAQKLNTLCDCHNKNSILRGVVENVVGVSPNSESLIVDFENRAMAICSLINRFAPEIDICESYELDK